MSTPFAHTLRSLEVDRSGGARAPVVLALMLFAAWLAWLFGARISVTEVSEDARVQVDSAGHELATAIDGRVVSVRVVVGDRVEAGQVLVELDDEHARMALTQAEERAESLAGVVLQRQREITAEREAIEALERAAGAAASEARARVDRAVAAARLAESELVEAEALQKAEVGTEAELRRSRAQAEQMQAATRELRSAHSRERHEQARELRDRLARIVQIEGEIATLEVERRGARGRAETLASELERHRLRAPVAGVVGELAAVERGSWIDRGEVLGKIVPEGALEIVADFEPSAAIGRVEIGQGALMRLDGFPWTQYGAVRATVARVASEPRHGMIRVELAVAEVPPTLSLEHGLPGTVEVEVEHTSPAALLLRAAGRRLSGTGVGDDAEALQPERGRETP